MMTTMKLTQFINFVKVEQVTVTIYEAAAYMWSQACSHTPICNITCCGPGVLQHNKVVRCAREERGRRPGDLTRSVNLVLS